MIFTASQVGFQIYYACIQFWVEPALGWRCLLDNLKSKTKIFSESDLTGVTSVLTLARPPSAWPSTITYWLWCAKISGHEKFRIGLISGTVLMQDRLVMMYWITENRNLDSSELSKAFAFTLQGKMKNLLLFI